MSVLVFCLGNLSTWNSKLGMEWRKRKMLKEKKKKCSALVLPWPKNLIVMKFATQVANGRDKNKQTKKLEFLTKENVFEQS